MNWKNNIVLQRAILAIYLSIFVLANIGAVVYTHSCSIDGEQISLYIQTEDPCQENDHPIKNKNCCSEQEEIEVHYTSDCCSTQSDYLSIDSEYRLDQEQYSISVNDIDVDQTTSPAFNIYLAQNQPSQDTSKTREKNPPPKKQGRTYQSILQIFTI